MTESMNEIPVSRKRTDRSEIFKEWPAAFSKFQGEITNPKMTADNPYFSSKYAPLEEILKVVRPVLAKHGLSIDQEVYTHEERHDHIVVQTTIYHESGEWREYKPIVLPGHQKLKDGRLVFNAQGAGSAITYAKRYQIQAALGIAADSDDDGETQAKGDRDNKKPLHVPKNMVSNTSEATLKAKYQLVMKKIDGFEQYCQKLWDKGHDNNYIATKLDEAYQKQKNQSA